MDPAVTASLFSLFGAVVGAFITYLTNRQLQNYQLACLREQFKTEYMAEETARHFLSHKGYVERSFDTLQMYLGGFTDDELRKILVRAGAVRTYRDDGSEWWKLLSRMPEFIDTMEAKHAKHKNPVTTISRD